MEVQLAPVCFLGF